MKREFQIPSLVCTTCGFMLSYTWKDKIMTCQCGTFPTITVTYDDHGQVDESLQELIREANAQAK